MRPKDAKGIANSVDPDQQSDLGLHCLARPICLKTFTMLIILKVEQCGFTKE